jgi:hypothetical protein
MRFEASFNSSSQYENPVQDVEVKVDFTSASGRKQTVFAFWDGGKIWKVRFSPDELGLWKYLSQSSKPDDSGLHQQSGTLTCTRYIGVNPLYLHGALGVSPNRRYLMHADGTPFFWLGDTCWNGLIKSNAADWEIYLQDRVAKGFTVVQTIATHWRAAATDTQGNPSYTGRERIAIVPPFFQQLDQRVDAINEHGLICHPILIHDNTSASPGVFLPDDQIVVLARYLVARYSANQVAWTLGGDGNYTGQRAERWKNIGRAVYGSNHSRLATMHPGGESWIFTEFREEPWFDFHGYQSGHRDSDKSLRWLCEGPTSRDWTNEPYVPLINLEPNYEAYNSYSSKVPFDAHAVRRAVYWSLLVSPTAGVAYGAHGVWGWAEKSEEPLGHVGHGAQPPWQEAIHLPGSTHMKYLKSLFSGFEWWRLRPAQEMLVNQPGAENPRRFVMIAKSEDGNWALGYMPEGVPIVLRRGELKRAEIVRWFNPRNGSWSGESTMNDDPQTLAPPDKNDWVFWIGAKGQPLKVSN